MACKLDLRRQVLEDLHSPFQDYTVSLIRDRAELNFNGVNNIDTIRLKIREINSQNAHDAVRLINMDGLKFLEFNPGPIADRYDSFSNFQDDVDLSNQALETQESKELPLKENLNTRLKPFLEEFNFDIQEYDSIKSALGYDFDQMVDLVSKFIAIEKDVSLDRASAYIAFKLLGKTNSKIRSELRFRIRSWDKFDTLFNKYKQQIFEREGFVEDKNRWKREVLDKIIIDFLAETIVEYDKNPTEFEKLVDKKWTKEDFTFIKKLWRKIKNLLKNKDKDNLILKNIGNQIAHEVLNNEYDILEYSLSEGQIQKYYKNTIESDLFAKDVVEFSQSQGIVLTGSLALRRAGRVYRTADETLHDIDFVVPYELSSREESFERLHKNILADAKTKSDVDVRVTYANRMIPEFIQESKWFKDFKKRYPTYKFLVGFVGSEHSEQLESITVTGVIDGEFDSNGEYIKDTGYIIDHFVRLKSLQEEHENYFKLWKEIMIAKLKMGRKKDLTDFKHFVPYMKSKDTFNFNYPDWVYFNTSDSSNKETITIDNLDLEFTSSEIEDIKTCS